MKPAAIELRIGRVVVHGGDAVAIDGQALAAALAEQLGRHWHADPAPVLRPAAHGAQTARAPLAPAPAPVAARATPTWAGALADAVAARWQPGSGGYRG
ncbi:MAG: hypothetical protein KGL43_05515 [Burkholderiales bacterium]|nr:hypothetical protein [Burkholderiales bacterium]MDE2453032.1 hypothetical protein [Burkholderiales bacterium]